MSWNFSRRDVLAALGTSLVVRALPAAEPAPGKVCLTLTYLNNNPVNKDMKFDAESFRDDYLPALRAAYGDSLEHVELRMPPKAQRQKGGKHAAAPPSGPPSPVEALISMWVHNMGAFAAATQKSGVEITAALLKVTNGQPHVQYEEVIGEWGQSRSSVALGTSGQVSLYPYSDGAKWDSEYYLGTYLPKMAAAYGEGALKRVEVRRGIGTQGGGKPLFINTVHVYAQDADKFRMAAFSSGKDLMADAMKVTTVFPFVANVNVLGVG